MAQLSPKPYPGFDAVISGESIDAYFARHNAILEELTAKSNALPEGVLVGALISFAIADGSALYLVIKEQPLTLQHVPFADAYRAHSAALRGLRRADVLAQLASARAWKKLLEGRAHSKASA